MDDTQAISQMMEAYEQFKRTMDEIRSEKRLLVADLRKKLEDAKVEEVLKKIQTM